MPSSGSTSKRALRSSSARRRPESAVLPARRRIADISGYQRRPDRPAGCPPDISASMAAAPTSPPADEAPSIKLEADRAYLELRDRIVTLRLAPGTVLREDELMRELAIGRTPLREAVKRLALENLVAVQPRRGTFVTAGRGRRHRQHHRGARRAGGLRRRARRPAPRRRPSRRRRGAAARGRGARRARRPGLADALRRAHPPLHLGGRRQPLPDRDARALLHPLPAHLVPRARPRCPGSATRSTTRPTCSRPCSRATPSARARSCASTCSTSSASCWRPSAGPERRVPQPVGAHAPLGPGQRAHRPAPAVLEVRRHAPGRPGRS